MKEILSLGLEIPGAVSGLRLEPANGLAMPRHFHEVNASMHFTPDGGKDSLELAVLWRDAGGGRAAVNLRLGDLPGGVRTEGSWSAVEEHFGRARTDAIQVAAEWLAAIERGAHEFVFAQTFHVVQRITAAARAGQPPGGDHVVRNRSEGTRRSALAHLNLWVQQVYPQWAGPHALRDQDRASRTSDRRL